MTFVFLGMFVASSAGEVLFNKEEADILLHRPVTPAALLWAKIGVLVEVSLWLAGAFNLGGLFVGFGPDGDGGFPLVHAFSTSLEALFCTGCVVLVYQLCLRWFGRERLEGLMTTAQVFVSIAAVLGGQIMPRFVLRVDGVLEVGEILVGLPAAAGVVCRAGRRAGRQRHARLVAAGGAGVAATALVLWLALWQTGARLRSRAADAQRNRFRPAEKAARRRWLDRLVDRAAAELVAARSGGAGVLPAHRGLSPPRPRNETAASIPAWRRCW